MIVVATVTPPSIKLAGKIFASDFFWVKRTVSKSARINIGLSFTALTEIKTVAESLLMNPSLDTNLNESEPKKLESATRAIIKAENSKDITNPSNIYAMVNFL